MPTLGKIVLLLLLVSIVLSANTDRALKMMKTEQRVALVIGNNNYNSDRLSKLKNPINDAKAIKSKLQTLGFKVYYGENLTVREMDKKLSKFSKKLRGGGVGLFFFAGHGVESRGSNYLMGKDSNLADKEDIAYESLELNKVIDKMKHSGNRLNIVLLDACRNDPFSRSGGGGLAKVSNAKGMFIAYATSPGDVASDGSGKHGVFTQEILNNIDAKGVSLHTVFKNVKRDVYNNTNHTQRPWTHDDIIGSFFFRLPTKNSSFNFSNVAPTSFSLNINTSPSNAKVVITNIKPRYYDGIKLKKGSYTIKVSKKGYTTKSGNIELSGDLDIDIALDKKQSSYATKTSTTNGKWNKKIFSGKRSYTKNSSNTVKDNYTGLIWQKTGSSSEMNLYNAKNYCSNLSQDGYSNWRLPTIKELRYLADRSTYMPAIDTKYFKSENSFYWTSSEYKGASSEAFIVAFGTGRDFQINKSDDYNVRCVVGRQ
ncbi:MAG: caspase family protein [Sulfurimonas sp.]|nr:caspase family protein [Sulfurimonas sp.]